MYTLLKIPAQIALNFYCRKITINQPQLLHHKGPLLIAANHPNSFLDAVIIASLFKKPVYSLARGDVFTNRIVTWILGLLNMLPVYRVSEGAENLEHNYTTFTECQDLFKKNGIVLIFSEGRCINEWHLRPLKKGTARLAISAWQNEIPLQILPLGINYSSFRFFGKNVILNFGTVISREDVSPEAGDGKNILAFNSLLEDRLRKLVIEIDPRDKEKIKRTFESDQPLLKKIILFLPSVTGLFLHFPLYYPVIKLLQRRANDHYDSLVVGLLFFIYPFYIVLITWIAFTITMNPMSFIIAGLLPFTAWSHLQLKRQIK
ncbi:MAG: 1-acyl-sn-glycerol-3-phosphate acyltransferase [Ginsengibacter sp.]